MKKCDQCYEKGKYKVLKETREVREYCITGIGKFQRSGDVFIEA